MVFVSVSGGHIFMVLDLCRVFVSALRTHVFMLGGTEFCRGVVPVSWVLSSMLLAYWMDG